MVTDKTILSLCDFSGRWSEPYLVAGYNVIRIDLNHGQDLRLMEKLDKPIHGILAAPPCTEFSGSGACWWKSKPESKLIEGLSVIDACLRAVQIYKPEWWVLENPVGRLKRYIGDWQFIFNPYEYAGWIEDSGSEAYTKKTCLWGDFTNPEKKSVEPVLGSLMNTKIRDPQKRANTPRGFAKAFFTANP